MGGHQAWFRVCKVAVHRQFNSHVRVPSNRFSLGTQQRTRVRRALRTDHEDCKTSSFVGVSAKQYQASDRVTKIKHTLQVLGDTEGPEVDGLRAALKLVECDTNLTPIHTQVKECESFLCQLQGKPDAFGKDPDALRAHGEMVLPVGSGACSGAPQAKFDPCRFQH